MRGSFALAGRSRHARCGAAALAALAHVLLAIALLRFAGMTGARTDEAPADQVAFAFIPVLAPPKAAAPQVHTPPAPPRSIAAPAVRSPRAVSPDPAPAPPADIVLSTPEASAAAPAGGGRLDMEALRAGARQVESERVPTALESLREAEQLRASDDSDLSRAVRRAKRPDCQTKYSGGEKLNLVLLIPLAIETITDKGCKW